MTSSSPPVDTASGLQPPPPPAAQGQARELSHSLAEKILRMSAQTEPLLFQALWVDRDARRGQISRCYIATEAETRIEEVWEASVQDKKTGAFSRRTKTATIPVSTTGPIIPVECITTVGAAGDARKQAYRVVLDRDSEHSLYLPFGQSDEAWKEMQLRLEMASVSLNRIQAQELARALHMICNTTALKRGRDFLDAYRAKNPDLPFFVERAGAQGYDKPLLQDVGMSSGLTVLIDPRTDVHPGLFGAPSQEYAYAECGWSDAMLFNPETGRGERSGKKHIVQGDPEYNGPSHFESGRGGFVHQAEEGTVLGWMKSFRALTRCSPLIGALVAAALGSLARGLLEVHRDFSNIMYVNGPPGKGKTIAMAVCASLYGYAQRQSANTPSPLVGADHTGTNLDRIAAAIRHGFMGIDELQQFDGGNPRNLGNFLMRLANSTPRGRTKKGGTVTQDTSDWDLLTAIAGNDDIRTLLSKAMDDKGADQYKKAILSRVLIVPIERVQVFPDALLAGAGHTSYADRRTFIEGCLTEMGRNHGTVYPVAREFLAENVDVATKAFEAGSRDYMSRFDNPETSVEALRGAQNGGYQEIGFMLLERRLGMSAEEILPFRQAWSQILDCQSEIYSTSAVKGDTSMELHDLITTLDELELLRVEGHFCERDGDSVEKQKAAAKKRERKTYLACLVQDGAVDTAEGYAGVLYIRPSGSTQWAAADSVRPALREQFRALEQRWISDRITTRPKSGGGDAVAKTIGGVKGRFLEIDLGKLIHDRAATDEGKQEEAAQRAADPTVPVRSWAVGWSKTQDEDPTEFLPSSEPDLHVVEGGGLPPVEVSTEALAGEIARREARQAEILKTAPTEPPTNVPPLPETQANTNKGSAFVAGLVEMRTLTQRHGAAVAERILAGEHVPLDENGNFDAEAYFGPRAGAKGEKS